MPALFAYLLSITVFVGAGYAGLVWLTEPPPAKPAAMSTVASAHLRPNFKPEVAAADDASRRDSVVSTSEPVSTPEPAAGDPTTPAPQSQAAVASVSEAKPEQPVQEAPQEARQDLRQDRSEGQDEADGAYRAIPVPASRHQLRSRARLAATTEHESSARSQGTPALAPKPLLLPRPVLSPNAANAVAGWFGAAAAEAHARPRPREPMVRDKQHSRREASRPRYVMMTLRTIEYPDGHREQRLLPLRQFWASSD
jgi:hypothetical protein